MADDTENAGQDDIDAMFDNAPAEEADQDAIDTMFSEGPAEDANQGDIDAMFDAPDATAEPAPSAIQAHFSSKDLAVLNVDVDVSVVLGKSDLRVHQLLKLGRGAVVELNQKTDDPVTVYANDILVAKGEVVVTDDDKIGVTLSEIVTTTED